MFGRFRFAGALVVSGALCASVASAEIVTRFDTIPATASYGDVWMFSCPSGGTFDVILQNRNDGYMGGGGPLDLYFLAVDAAGMGVGGGDDEVLCMNTPACGGCAQVTGLSCGTGGRFAIKVGKVINCGGAGVTAGYALALEVRDSGGNSLPAKKVKLGGGPKIKVPAWHSPTSLPVIDDGPLD